MIFKFRGKSNPKSVDYIDKKDKKKPQNTQALRATQNTQKLEIRFAFFLFLTACFLRKLSGT